MSEDWKPGDLALCVKSGPGTESGRIYTVADVCEPGAFTDTGAYNSFGCLALRFTEIDYAAIPHCWSSCTRFRKIRPHTPDEEDRETIALLTGNKQPVEA